MAMRNRVLTGVTCVALIAGLTACGTTATTTTTIAGTTLTIYASVPLSGPESAVGHDVLAAEQLALQQAGGRAGRFTLKLKPLNDATSAGWSPKLIAINARNVIQDATAVAYIGETDPNASAQSVPITNADDLLQVTPYDSAIGLTRATPAVPGAPNEYYESLSTNGRTFGRVVPTDNSQAKAQLQVMQGLGVKKLFILEDGGAYGDAFALAVQASASKYGITALAPARSSGGLAASGADALFYGGAASPAAAHAFNAAISSAPGLKLFGPGGVDASAFASQLSPAAASATYLGEPAVTAAELPAAGQKFLTDFKAAYGHAPATQAIFGYAAVQAVLRALTGAGANANNRSDDVSKFFGAKNVSSVLGTYSIDKNGDPTFTPGAPYIFSRVKAHNPVFFKALTVP